MLALDRVLEIINNDSEKGGLILSHLHKYYNRLQ